MNAHERVIGLSIYNVMDSNSVLQPSSDRQYFPNHRAWDSQSNWGFFFFLRFRTKILILFSGILKNDVKNSDAQSLFI